jgi:hypothetical protein
VTALVPESECKSEMSGMLSGGGTNTVEAEPEPDLVLLTLSIVLMEPAGERVTDRSGSVTLLSNASLYHV